jgi:hypothetical protein
MLYFLSHRRHGQEWVSDLCAPLKNVITYCSDVLDPILKFRVSIKDSLRLTQVEVLTQSIGQSEGSTTHPVRPSK